MLKSPRSLCLAILLAAGPCALAADYDVLIRGGTVYDGTGAPPYPADVAISGDRVAAVGALGDASADVSIDARGMAVSPGFFNLLSHAHRSLLQDGRALSDIKQGVTFEVLSEVSLSPITAANPNTARRNRIPQRDMPRCRVFECIL